MLQTREKKEKMEKDIERSLENLKLFSNSLDSSLPPFYYSADLLLRYAQQNGQENINNSYFRNFKKDIQILRSIDETKIKKHEKDIIEQILEIVNSSLFIECMRPDIKSSRNLHIQNGDGQAESLPPSKEKLPLTASLNIKNSFHQKQQTQSSLGNKEKQDAQSLWQKLKIAYKQHRIDEANELKNIFRKKQYTTTEEQQNLFSTIELQYKTMMDFYVQFDQEGWEFDREEDGVTLEFKVFEEQKQIAIRIESEFDIRIENFLAILCEMQLFGDYVPFCYDSKEQKFISRNQKIGSSKIYIPLLTDRQTFFYAVGYDRYKVNGSVFLYSKTINTDMIYQQKYDYKVPDKTDYVRLEYKFFLVEYIPITRERARVRLASKIDMKMNFVPLFIINASARKFAFNYFKNIIRVNKKFKGSKWQERIKEDPDFYMFFKRKIDQYLP